MRVLLPEDDSRLAAVLEQSLTEAGWTVEVVPDGRSAYGRALPDGLPYDVLVLDWMLPELDGLTVCRRLRDLGVTTPVLMLTARGDVRDRIHGLDAGTCGTGSTGCSGTVAAAGGSAPLGTVPFDMEEENTKTLHFSQAVPLGAPSITFTITTMAGVGPTSPVTLTMPPS